MIVTVLDSRCFVTRMSGQNLDINLQSDKVSDNKLLYTISTFILILIPFVKTFKLINPSYLKIHYIQYQ